MATRLGKPKSISREKALSRLFQAAKSPTIDRGRAAKNVAPAKPKTKADFAAQRRWWAAPTQMDFEDVDTPASPPFVTKSEIEDQEAVTAAELDAAKEVIENTTKSQGQGEVSSELLDSLKTLGETGYYHNQPLSPLANPYIVALLEEENLKPSEYAKAVDAYAVGWLSGKDKSQSKEVAKEGAKADAEVINSTKLVGQNAYLNDEPILAEQAPYLMKYIEEEGFTGTEKDKVLNAFEAGWLSAQARWKAQHQAQVQAGFKKVVHFILKEQFGMPNVAKDASTETLMLLLADNMGGEAGKNNLSPEPGANLTFMATLKQANLKDETPILKAYIESWENQASMLDTDEAPGSESFSEIPKPDPKNEPVLQAKPLTPSQASKTIKASPSPLDSSGKPLIKAFNLKKMESLALAGDAAELVAFAEELEEKMLSKAKKAAIQNALQELLAQMTGQEQSMESVKESGYSELIEDVSDGDQPLPSQSFPTAKTMAEEEAKFVNGGKNYDKDLEEISGKKGSNEGGLYKDKNLQTFHYVKWPGDGRARVEALANRLYMEAGVPVPSVSIIELQGKTAIMSDWIDGVKPMTLAEMAQHPDVRRNFVVDAWLANWDAVGMGADNIVLGPTGTAYRIDPGGSLIYRAQGGPKQYPAEAVAELQSMRQPSTAPQASQVFGKLTQAELKAGAKAVSLVTDQQIDNAVDSVGLSVDHEIVDVSNKLKKALKARRDIIITDVLNAKPAKKLTAKELQKKLKDENLTLDTLKIIATDGEKFTPGATGKFKATRQVKVLTNELGSPQSLQSDNIVRRTYNAWKGSTTTTEGALLRWAIARAVSEAEGDRELDKMREFWTVAKYGPEHGLPKSQWEEPNAQFKNFQKQYTDDLVKGIDVTRAVNHAVQTVQTKGKDDVVIYRTWRPDQVKTLGWQSAQVGDIINVPHPSAFSWSFSPHVFADSVGHGGIRVKSTVPLKHLHLSDRVNNTFSSYQGEDEVIFKGPSVTMEVIKTG